MSNSYGGYNFGGKDCHIGPKEVMQIGEAKIWAGGWREMDHDMAFDLRIRLNDAWALRAGMADLLTYDQEAASMLGPKVTELNYPPTLNVDWEDFMSPPLEKEWWQELIVSIKRLGPVNIAIYCQGGHGRTGTALSILASLSGQKMWRKEDCVAYIRRIYCQEAVESWTQIDYIQSTLGEAIESYPTSYFKKPLGATPAYKKNTEADGTVTYEVEWIKPEAVKQLATGQIGPATTQFDPANKRVYNNNEKVVMHQLKGGGK